MGDRAAASAWRRARRPRICFARRRRSIPNDADLFFNLGYAHWIAREYPQAVAALREAVRRNPADDDAHYVLGAALQASGAADEGAREKDLARRLSSVYSELDARRTANSVPRGLERLKTELDAGVAHPRRQRDHARRGSASSASWSAFYLANGRRLSQAERDAEALAELRRAVFLSPYDSEAHLLIGRVLLRLRARAGGDRRAQDFRVEPRHPGGPADAGRGLRGRARLRRRADRSCRPC